MKLKILFIFFFIILLSSCKNAPTESSINEILIKIKDYTCSMSVTIFSNKNSHTYNAYEEYIHPDNYSILFDNFASMQIKYSDNILSIGSDTLGILKDFPNHENLNQNPLFLSYFLNTYFSNENPECIILSDTFITLKLPSNSKYLDTATLVIENNLPYSLTYFDKNGNIKVNIIYNEFKILSS